MEGEGRDNKDGELQEYARVDASKTTMCFSVGQAAMRDGTFHVWPEFDGSLSAVVNRTDISVF